MRSVHLDIPKSGVWLYRFIWSVHSHDCSNWSLCYSLLAYRSDLSTLKVFIWGRPQALGEAVVSLSFLRSRRVVILFEFIGSLIKHARIMLCHIFS